MNEIDMVLDNVWYEATSFFIVITASVSITVTTTVGSPLHWMNFHIHFFRQHCCMNLGRRRCFCYFVFISVFFSLSSFTLVFAHNYYWDKWEFPRLQLGTMLRCSHQMWINPHITAGKQRTRQRDRKRKKQELKLANQSWKEKKRKKPNSFWKFAEDFLTHTKPKCDEKKSSSSSSSYFLLDLYAR